MRKLLTAGIFGTILSLTGANYAGASIISRGFFDEAMENYATNTALDLKANQSDFTELNTQISNSVDYLKTLWNPPVGELVHDIDPNKFNNDIEGAFGLVEGFILHSMLSLTGGWTSDVGIGLRIENYYDYNPGLEGMFNGWTIYNPSGSETMVFKGLENISSQIRTIEDTYHTGLSRLLVNGENKINVEAYNYTGPIYPLWKLSEGVDKIGTLPAGITVQGMYDGWTEYGNELPGLYEIASDTMKFKSTFPKVSIGTLLALGLEKYTNGNYTGPIYPLWKLSEGIDKIGTLPSGSLLNQTPFTDELYKFTQGTDSPVYPNTMADLVKQIYGEFSSSGNHPGLVHLLITGFLHNDSLPVNSNEIGILPAMSLAETANETANAAKSTAQANAVKIGDLPSGQFHIRFPYLSIFESAGIAEPYNYPTSLSDLFLYLFGSNEDTTKNGLFPVIGMRLNNISTQINNINNTSNAIQSKIGTVPDGKNLAGMIGTVPDGYDNVGAALTAMKSDIDAKNLPSTSDDGQYVLTAKKVGDTITYTWVKMDLTNEEQAQ